MRQIVLATMMLMLGTSVASAQRPAAPVGPANPFAGNKEAISQGETVFNANCTSCHGMYGNGATAAPLAAGYRPDLFDQDSAIFKRIKMGAPGTLMPAFSGKLSDDDIWKLAAYIKGLRGMAINAPVNGDVNHGHDVFFGKGECSDCHMVGGQGAITAPDLSNIADLRKVGSIVDALTKPSHRVLVAGGAHPEFLSDEKKEYLQVHVVQSNGKVINGTLMHQSLDELDILGDDKELHLLERAKVKTLAISDKSAMPTDYDKRLTPVEFTDLLAFLTRQSAKPAPLAGRGGNAGGGGGE